MRYKRILIVDDSATARMIIKRCLQIAGCHDAKYYEAEDGIQAISFLQENEVDLILSDLTMPKMDGKTLIKKLQLRQGMEEIPVVVISSMGNEVTESQLLKAGAKAIIKKPISPAKIVEVLGAEQ